MGRARDRDPLRDERNPEVAERLEAAAPEEAMRRRDFLQRTAVAGGLAASLGTVLSPDVLLGQAAKRSRTPIPSRRNLPIDTVVVLMMENRSFDHYLGWLPGADGRQKGLVYTDKQGKRHATHRLAPDFQGCGFADPDHSWDGGRVQLNHGRMDGFLRSGDNDVYSIGYYTKPDLPFLPAAARAFTTFDRFFCSLLGSTYPNREYMHAAQSYGKMNNSLPAPPGFPDTTIFAALAAKGISNRYFYSDVPFSALWGVPGLTRSSPVQEYYDRCAAGTLPALSFVDPPFSGEEAGTSGDEHPHGDVRTGQAFMADVVHAFLESKHWRRGALFIVYDEWGGFFEHVRPPRVPDDRANRKLSQDFGQMGFRIPAVAVSPYVRRGHVDHNVYGFESILKLIEYRYGLRPLTVRDRYAANVLRSFDFESRPDFSIPRLPHPPHVASQACPSGSPAPRSAPAEQEISALHTSGYLERLGFDYTPATPERIFRHPSSLRLGR